MNKPLLLRSRLRKVMATRFCSRERTMDRLVKCGRTERFTGLSAVLPVCKGHSLQGSLLSIRLINAVIENAPVHGGEYLLLLCMARYAADDGTRVFPSVGTLALDTRQSERAIHMQLRSLESKGLIVRVGVSRHSTINYRIAVEMLCTGGERASPSPVNVIPPTPERRSNTPEQRSPDSSSNTSLNRQQPLEQNLKTVKGSEALKSIAAFLPKFKSAHKEGQ